ncbi:hypothetical protein O6H91_22G071100 [Diphasiastrum complanatum]|nr:hypothetical protein O6H91_22G071100 [Diphasiastrum complanatum]
MRLPSISYWDGWYKMMKRHSCCGDMWVELMKAQRLQIQVALFEKDRDCMDYLCRSTCNLQGHYRTLIESPMPEKTACILALQVRSNDSKSRNHDKRSLFFVGMPYLLFLLQTKDADATEISQVYGDVASLVEVGVQFIYLGSLLVLLGIGSFLVVRQILFRRELETAAKELQDRVRTGQASPMEYFELGAVMLRKKFYVLATKYLEQAVKKWDGDEQDLAQVYNALGFSCFSEGKLDLAISQYEKAVKLSPGYVTAWNNLGNAYEKKKDWSRAYKAYDQALQFEPGNKVALTYRDAIKERLERFRGVPTK